MRVRLEPDHMNQEMTSSFDAARAPMVMRSSFLPFKRTLSDTSSRASTSIVWPGYKWWLSMKRRKAAS